MSRTMTKRGRRLRRGSALGLGLVLLATPAAWASAVDDFTDPLAIAPSGGITGIITTSAFTVQGGEPTSADGTCPARAKTAWFSIVGNGLPITAATDATSFDTVVAAYPTTGPSATPSFEARVACDGDGTGNSATITFPSTRGKRYLVQVGGKNSASGSVRMKFTVTRPANDDRSAASVVTLGAPVTVDQSGATSEAGEILSCGASIYAGTVWFRYTATRTINAQFSSTGSLAGAVNPTDTVLAVYPGGTTTAEGCNDDSGPTAGPSGLSLHLTPGDYYVQVGARGPDTAALGAGPVTLSVTDRDARLPLLSSKISGSFALKDGDTRIKALTVRRAAAGSTIAVSCKTKAKGCPGNDKPLRIKKDKRKVSVLGSLSGRQLRPGARVTVTVQQPGFTGLVTTYQIRDGKPPKRIDLCLAPGALSGTSCPG